jgi:glutathione S-transferase
MARPIVYGLAGSAYTWSARLALAEKGVVHEFVDIGSPGALREEEHLARHPFARMPAFEHDGFMLYETQAIVRYVDEAFPATPLQSTDVHEWSRMNQVIGIVDAYVAPSIGAGIVFQRLVAPRLGLAPDEAAVAAALPQARLCLAELARLMGEQPWLAGPLLTLADLMAIPLLYYFSRIPDGSAPFAEHPNLTAWLRRMEARQSFQVTKPAWI